MTQLFIRGVKTSEFWLSVAVVVLLQLDQMGLLPKPSQDQATQVGMIVAVIVYTIARTLTKSGATVTFPSVSLPATLSSTSDTPLPPLTLESASMTTSTSANTPGSDT